MNRRSQNCGNNGYPAAAVLMGLILLSWVFGAFSAPGWAYAGLLLLSGLVAAWIVHDLARNREGEGGYLVALLALFVLLDPIADELDAPGWINIALIVLFAPVAVWTVRYALKTLR